MSFTNMKLSCMQKTEKRLPILTVYTCLSIHTRADLQPQIPIVFLFVDVYPLQIEFSQITRLFFFQ